MATGYTPLASMAVFGVSHFGRSGLSVTYLDVGQGDSAVIEASGKVIAIDTGRTGRELSAYLKYLGKGIWIHLSSPMQTATILQARDI